MPRITKAELLARIDALEAELGLKDQSLADMERELNAYQVAERPSRRERSSTDFAATVVAPIVFVGGQRCTKRTAWEHGRRVTTYTPLTGARP